MDPLRKKISMNIQKVMKDKWKILQSGMLLTNKMGIFKEIEEEPKTVSDLARLLKMKERYCNELTDGIIAMELILINEENKLFLPRGSYDDLQNAIKEAAWEEHFLQTLPFLEACYAEDGRLGYSYDEEPAMLHLLDLLQDPFINSLAQDLKKCIDSYHPGKPRTVLDFGCANGKITIPLGKLLKGGGVSVIGCDTSGHVIETARKGAKGVPNVSFVEVDGKTYPKEWESMFDVIVMSSVLHDLPFPKETMEGVKKLLKDDGILIITDPGVSSDPKKNVGNLNAAKAIIISSCSCLPTSCHHKDSAALGVTWGKEKKEIFLKEMGFTIEHKTFLLESLLYHTCVCVKTTKKQK